MPYDPWAVGCIRTIDTMLRIHFSRLLGVCCGLVFCTAAVLAAPRTESVEQALCRLIEDSARSHDIPSDYLTRLIWQESSFRANVISSAGAQGIAQFMPGTAKERGLLDPFDPEQAIPKAAELIAELTARFGNRGLAAAAYNGGSARVAGWLAAERGLPPETRQYVYRVTGQSAEEWAAARFRNESPGAEFEPVLPRGDGQPQASWPRRRGGRTACPVGRAIGGQFLQRQGVAQLRPRKSGLCHCHRRPAAHGDRHPPAEPRDTHVLSRSGSRGITGRSPIAHAGEFAHWEAVASYCQADGIAAFS